MNPYNLQQNEYKSYSHSNVNYGHESMGPLSPNIKLICTKPTNQYQNIANGNGSNH